MVGRSIGVKGIGKLGTACAVALLAVGAGPAIAWADAPSVTITAPSSGTLTKESSLGFSGATNDTLESVLVDIYEGVGTGTAPVREESTFPTGNEWSLQAPSLPDGTYTAVARQGTAEVGFSAEVTFTIDTTAPELTLEPVPALLATATPSFGGTGGQAEGDGSVRVLIDGAVAGEVPVSGGKWTFNSPLLSDGNHTLSAEQTDEAGNAGTTGVASFRVDTTAPNPLSLDAVPTVLADPTPAFGGSGGQAAGDGPVKVFIDGKLAGEAPVSGGGWAFSSAALSDGNHTVSAEQSDEAGNTSKTTTASFRLDTTAPAPTVTAPKPSEKLKTSTVEFKGTAGGATGDAAEVTVEIFRGESTAAENLESSFGVARSGSSWSSGSSGPQLSNGTFTVRVRQADSVGNLGVSSPVTFTVDAKPPTLTLEPVPAVIPTSTPTFSGTGSEEPGDGPVRVLLNGKAAEVPVSGGKWTFTSPAALSDGSYTLLVERSDEVGNASKPLTASFRIDTVGPAPTVTAPKAGGEPLKSSLVEFKGTAGNDTGDASEVTVEVFSGESTAAEHLEQRFFVKRSGSSWSSGSGGPRLPNGVHTVRVDQADSAGHLGSSAPVTFAVKSPAPNVTLNEPPPFTARPMPSFSGSADASAEAKSEVILKIWQGTSGSGKPLRTVKAAVLTGTWSAGPVEALEDGTYIAQAEQPALQAGNQPGVSNTTIFTVDTQAPKPTLVAPSETTGLETVSGLAGAAPGDLRQVTAELFSGTTAEAGALFETITVNDTLVEGRATWNATFADLPGGRYTVIAHQADEAGNVGTTEPETFTVNAPAPAPSPAPASPSPPAASFTWVPAEPTVGQSVSFVSKSTDASSPITGYGWDLAGNGPFAPGGPLATTTFATAGAHTVRLQVSDANGLSSLATETIQVAPQALTLMQPFPIVRIAGAETSDGVRIRLLSVQAPPTATVAVSCKGRGCKTRSENRVVTASSKGKSRPGAVTLSFPRFQRALKAGTVLQIRVSKLGRIGKFTSFTIRRGKLPVRVDSCLRPPSTRPIPCPSQ